MKTSELIKKLSDYGITVELKRTAIFPGVTYINVNNFDGHTVCRLSSKDTNWFDVSLTGYANTFYKKTKEKVASVISEYLNTPLDERDPKKKYRVRLQGFNQGNHQYLSTDSNPYMGQIFASTWGPCYKQVFTKSELEAIQNRPQFKNVGWFRELIKDGLREFNGDDNE